MYVTGRGEACSIQNACGRIKSAYLSNQSAEWHGEMHVMSTTPLCPIQSSQDRKSAGLPEGGSALSGRRLYLQHKEMSMMMPNPVKTNV